MSLINYDKIPHATGDYSYYKIKYNKNSWNIYGYNVEEKIFVPLTFFSLCYNESAIINNICNIYGYDCYVFSSELHINLPCMPENTVLYMIVSYKCNTNYMNEINILNCQFSITNFCNSQ